MLVQVRLQRERLLAVLAPEVLVGRMGLHVRPQVGPVGEGFPAMGAPVRFFPGVGPEMALEEPRPAELFTAHSATVG